MPRRKNTKPTNIYWLVDMRPETIAAGYHNGYPFYCGKTVKAASTRLQGHLSGARKNAQRMVCLRIREIDEQFVRILVVETVPHTENWIERERSWIRVLRFSFPDNCNVADGGAGSPGLIMSAERRAQIGAFHKGRPTSPETRAKMSAVQKGRRLTDEHKAKLKAAWQANPNRFDDRVVTDETRAKQSAALKGKKRTPEARARMSAAKKGKPVPWLRQGSPTLSNPTLFR